MKHTSSKHIGRKLSVLALLAAFALPMVTNAATFLTSTLRVGTRGTEVSALQQFLRSDPTVYPQGLVTGYFGALTKAAVQRFQATHGLSADGIVGPMTRAEINALGNLTPGSSAGTVPGNTNLAPIMSAVALTVNGTSTATTSNNATVNTSVLYWTTNELTRAKLYVSPNPIVVQEVTNDRTEPVISGTAFADPNFSTTHSFPIVNLFQNTPYYFVAVSVDVDGNVTVSPAGTFRSGY